MKVTPRDFEIEMEGLVERKAEDYDFGLQELHEAVDDLMCETLISLGYSAGVEIFKNIKKWYA